MPPEENKTQDISQQDTIKEESVVAENSTLIKQPTESAEFAPIIEQEEVTPPSAVVEPPTETTQPEPTPIIPPLTSAQAEPIQETPQPKIQERIIYKTDPNIVQKLLIKARAKIQERKRKKLDKIMTLFEAKPQITNKDIQKLLRISRVSAFRYFNILEKQNRIKQVGNTGKSVFYTKI